MTMKRFPSPPALTPAQLRGLRRQLGISAVAMASFMDVSYRHYLRWEGGAAEITGPAARLAEWLHRAGLPDLTPPDPD